MGADKNGDFVWIGNSFGGNLAKVNIHTKETTLVPLPNPELRTALPGGGRQGSQRVDPPVEHGPGREIRSAAGKWTLFDLPNRGTETRHISLLERAGQPMQVVIPYSRTRKVAVMTPRTEAEIAALKAQVGR